AGQGGPLEGVPIAHKDIFVTRDFPTTAGSRMLEGYRSPFDATVVNRLAQAGMVTLGKLNCDEFAMGSANENSAYGVSRNPWDLQRVPGGSSGGSAAALAAGLTPAATGTDTGGSIRQPASFCGITGIKPTYGRASRYGMIAYASSLDQAGPMARSAEDCALLLSAMCGPDPDRDSTSLDVPAEDFTLRLNDSLQGLRIGLPAQFWGDGLADDVRAAIDQALAELKQLGAVVVPVQLPRTELSIPVYYILAPAEASSNLSRFDGVKFGHRAADPVDLLDLYRRTRSEGFGEEVQRRIMIGTYVLSHGYYDAYYLQAQKIRRMIASDFQQAFTQCDVIAGPVAPTVAWALGEKSADPLASYLADIYTLPASLAGLPGMSVPCGLGAGGMPVGMQLIGNYLQESRLLNVAHQLQRQTDWHQQRPALASKEVA
ncbi:MAG: Asp-tRNA(Asn)/Glu-tRNA(Gln) amidotransferase subunit GatA, partial [Limnohabitans sp.]